MEITPDTLSATFFDEYEDIGMAVSVVAAYEVKAFDKTFRLEVTKRLKGEPLGTAFIAFIFERARVAYEGHSYWKFIQQLDPCRDLDQAMRDAVVYLKSDEMKAKHGSPK